jgi:anaerobic dimethyl sulfoxide reductase subunit A
MIQVKEFREDPIANPRPMSASGKLEIYCQSKADCLNIQGFSEEPFKPYPTYHVPRKGYEESFEDWNNKAKGAHPLQLFNPHYLRRAHTTFDDVTWLREAFANPVFMNTQDAVERGIANGDFVLVYNEYGKVTRQASLLDTYMPGTVGLPHGGWPEIDPETGVNHGGSENTLYGPVVGGSAVSGFNTCLVEIEKYSDQALLPDAERPLVLPKGIEG